jgi:RNase H-fold protein (predicted Holliday junction resolvase)
MTILSIDPGTVKCGLAVVRRVSGQVVVLHHEVVAAEEIVVRAEALQIQFDLHSIIVGNATQGKAILRQLRQVLPDDVSIGLVREDHTTEQARDRYWQEHPRHGLQKLLPRSLCTPPCPYDDYAAVVLAEQYLLAPPPR